MYRTVNTTLSVSERGYVPLSFRDAEDWNKLKAPPLEGRQLALLLGDDDVGPLVVCVTFPPSDEEMERALAHGHDSDNWRITLLGESHMGPATYGPGEFRFQDGGKAYGADDYAAGPDGGYALLVFADRRGFPIRPVQEKHKERYRQLATKGGEVLGITVADPYPSSDQALRTTLGSTNKAGAREGSFAQADSWPEIGPGLRATAAIMGSPAAGPIVLLLDAHESTRVVPSCQLSTDLLLLVVAGSCTIDGHLLEMGDMRLQLPDERLPTVFAGPDGVSLVMLVADRRAFPAAEVEANEFGHQWNDALDAVVRGLVDDVAAGART
jgi:hypothetical protein